MARTQPSSKQERPISPIRHIDRRNSTGERFGHDFLVNPAEFPQTQSFSYNANKPPNDDGASEIPNRLPKHVFRAENSIVNRAMDLDWVMAAKIARKAADQSNHLWER